MKNSDVTMTPPKKGIKPFEVKQMLVALELTEKDGYLLQYINNFTAEIPVRAAYFMHVLPQFDLFDALFSNKTEELSSMVSLDEAYVKRMEDRVKENVLAREKMYIEYEVKEGNPLEELLKVDGELKTDLVVIGQRKGTNKHGVLARNLVRRVNGNALIIPEGSPKSISKIVVPVDFSENSARSLRTALAIRKQLKGMVRVVCLNVYEMPDLSVYRLSKSREQFQNMIESNIMDGFRAFVNTYAPGEFENVEYALVSKDLPGTARYIFDYAKDNQADLVVMGAKGHSRVELLLLGSVTEKLLTSNEGIPTLVVK